MVGIASACVFMCRWGVIQGDMLLAILVTAGQILLFDVQTVLPSRTFNTLKSKQMVQTVLPSWTFNTLKSKQMVQTVLPSWTFNTLKSKQNSI